MTRIFAIVVALLLAMYGLALVHLGSEPDTRDLNDVASGLAALGGALVALAVLTVFA